MEGMTLEKLKVVIEAYTKPYKDEMDKIRQKTAAVTSQVERETSKMRNAFSKTAKVIGAVVSVTAIASFTKSCIELGSNLSEVQNVVDVTFGEMNRQVDTFAKNAMKQFGLSELTTKKYMGTYGAMAKSFNIVGEAGYQMSAAITGLTGDVASFYNLTTDEAYTKLKSIFTGETESLKDLGVVMTQTALDQYALNEGLGKTTSNMTEQEKVMLRYRFVMSSLSDASGDFERTSHSWANQVRVLQLQFESLKATIGQGLINAFTPAIQVINTLLAKLQTLADYFRAFTEALFGNAGGGALSDVSGALAESTGAVADNMGSAAKAAKDMKKSLASFDELNNLSSGSSSGGSGSGGVDFGSFNGELFGETTINPEIEEATNRIRIAVEELREAAGPAREALERLWDEGLKELGDFSWTGLQDFWEYFLKPLGEWTLGEGFPRFADITNDFLTDINWTDINEALREFWTTLEPFGEYVGEGLLWFYENVLAPLAVYAVNYTLPNFLQLLSGLLEDLDICVGQVKPAVEWLEEKTLWLKTLFEGNPLILKWVNKESVDNLFESVEAFKIIKSLADAMDGWNGLSTWYEEQILPYLDEGEWTNLWNVIPITMGIMWKQYKRTWKSEMETWWIDQVSSWFVDNKWATLYETIYEQLMKVLDKTEAGWCIKIAKWWSDNVKPWFTLEEWKSIMSGIPAAFSSIFKDAVNAGVEQLNKLIDWVNKKLRFDYEGFEIAGNEIIPPFSIQLFRIPHIPTFAGGGFPAAGQLFIANESGPELVGRIGNRTAVANADQIVDAVAQGVYMAISGAGMADEEAMYRAFKRAFEEVRPEAVMDSDRAFKNMQSKAAEYRKRTGKPAFGY